MRSRLSSLWKTLFRKDALDGELENEIQAAVETLADRYESEGMSPELARRAALEVLGGAAGITQVKEDVRDARVGAGLDSLLLDIRYAWRDIRKARTFTAVIVVTLALGIGANTAIFSVVHALLLEPLPYREADRLAFIWLGASRAGPLSGPDFHDIREGTTTFAELGGIWASGTVALTGHGDPEQLRSSVVTTNFFQVLGAESALGRTFRAADAAAGAAPTILIAWDLFQRRFGGDPSIVGRQILVNDQLTTVIGVMPRTFRLLLPADSGVPDRLQVWQPLWPDFEGGPRGNQFLRVVGRMRPGVTIAQARSEVDQVARRIAAGRGASYAFTTVALQADAVRDIRGPLLALFAAVAILLMIACVNVGSLLIARAASRARAIATRLALGASRGRLLRQSLIEGLLLAGLGAAGGVLAGYAGLSVLAALAPESLRRIDVSRMDPAVFAYTLAISLLWGVLFSLAPMAEVLKHSRSPQHVLVRAGGRSAAPVRYRARATLVVVQIALSVVLLVGAGLLARAFVEVRHIDIGFRADRRLTFRVALPDSRYPTTEALLSASSELRQRLVALPGVTGVGAISHLPYDDLPNWGLTYALDATGLAVAGSEVAAPRATTRSVSTGLFETLGVQLVDGRFFTDDDSGKNPVVIVDDMLAQRLWPGRRAVGQQLRLGQATPSGRATVVGVVRHLRLRSLVDDLAPQIFIPYRAWQRSPMAYVVRTDKDPSALAAAVRAAVAALDPQLPIYDLRPMDGYVEDALSIRRFTMLLAAVFAASALVLTCIGVYGVLAYAVARRRHELGVRRALGASTPQVMRDVVREGMGLALAGCAAGVGGAALAARLLQTQLYGIHPRDPIAYGASLALVLIGAACACWIPGRRATTVSPMDALRAE